jgi:carbonic anhydrase/acetyltransferase-like protein (isoleucine patch superfamily)
MEGSVVEPQAVLAPGTVVPPGALISGGQLWSGVPARYVRDLTKDEVCCSEPLALA